MRLSNACAWRTRSCLQWSLWTCPVSFLPTLLHECYVLRLLGILAALLKHCTSCLYAVSSLYSFWVWKVCLFPCPRGKTHVFLQRRAIFSSLPPLPGVTCTDQELYRATSSWSPAYGQEDFPVHSQILNAQHCDPHFCPALDQTRATP